MNLQSKELFINMKESDIPVWNELYSFDEQEDDVKQFWENEADKLANGVNINGVYIHPWLYWHINFWKMMLDVKDDSSPTGFVRVPGNTMLRDCEWLFTEFLQKAEEENKGIFMFGTRRFGKALLNSELLYMEDGEKRIGDVIVGDKIYDDSGKLTEVIGVYPQGRVTTYKVTFEDGRNVICCGDHIWKVWHMNGWRIKPLKSIMGLEYDKMSIPLCEGVEYPKAKLPINPSTYGAMVASWLAGSEPEIFFDSNLCRKFLRASLEQKEMFINSFIKFFKGVVTNDDVIPVTYVDYDVIRFVQRIFWSFGWYAMFNGSELHVSGIKRKLKISSIEIYGKENATCITVDNTSRLFLTTNYIVTHNTAIMSSFLGRNATMTYNLTHNVIGSSKEDLASMAEYLEFGLDNLPSYLRINRTGNDWSKEVILGTKSLNNIRDVHARVRIMNIDSGKVGASLKTAGGTPYTSIYDEVGKFPVLGAYLAGKPAHMMHGKMRGMIILSGTGGNVEKSQDAQKIMNSPSDYGFIVMDYDLLNKRTTKPTWRICQSGCFVPAQMSHSYPKVETTLDKYLNVDKAPGLKKIKIQVSDFDKNTDVIKEKLDELVTKDRSLFVQQKMAYPLTIDDCFLNQNVNRFPVEDALIHKNRILEEGRTGKLVDVYQVDGKRMGWGFSEKQLAPYPFKGGNIECPVVLYEDPPEEGGNFDYTYVSGCLLPGTLVLSNNGWKRVEDINIEDDYLVDKDGQIVETLGFMAFDKKDEDVYTLNVSNAARSVTFTKEHPIYVSKDPSVRGVGIKEDLFDFDFMESKDVKEGYWVRMPNIYNEERNIKINEGLPFDIDCDFVWFLGVYVGDGCLNKKAGQVVITISKSESFISDRIKSILESKGVNVSIKEDKSCLRVSISNSSIVKWIESNIGIHSYGKDIPDFIKYSEIKTKLSFVQGYMDSDGCVYKSKDGVIYTEFVSVNLSLLESLQHVLFSLGVVSNISLMRKSKLMNIEGRDVNTKDCYHLRISNNGSYDLGHLIKANCNFDESVKTKKILNLCKRGRNNRKDCFISSCGKYIYSKIKKIEKRKYTGVVYNLYDVTHSYLVMNYAISNCDPYKQDKSNTESLGAFYILKRHVKINDPFAYKIVASYVSRPGISDDFCRTVEILIEAYGAKCLMENADRMLETYLSRRNKELVLLEDGEKLANKIIRTGSRQNNKLGLSPTVPNQRMLFNTVIQYCWEEVVVGYDDEGNEITQKGIYRIDDIELLDEIIAFGPNVNTDRIIAFGHALLLAKYYDDMGFMPESTTQKMNREKREERKKYQMGGFTLRRRNPFTSLRKH